MKPAYGEGRDTPPVGMYVLTVAPGYVLYEGVTVMGFKVASRVRQQAGLSDEAFGEAFGVNG